MGLQQNVIQRFKLYLLLAFLSFAFMHKTVLGTETETNQLSLLLQNLTTGAQQASTASKHSADQALNAAQSAQTAVQQAETIASQTKSIANEVKAESYATKKSLQSILSDGLTNIRSALIGELGRIYDAGKIQTEKLEKTSSQAQQRITEASNSAKDNMRSTARTTEAEMRSTANRIQVNMQEDLDKKKEAAATQFERILQNKTEAVEHRLDARAIQIENEMKTSGGEIIGQIKAQGEILEGHYKRQKEDEDRRTTELVEQIGNAAEIQAEATVKSAELQAQARKDAAKLQANATVKSAELQAQAKDNETKEKFSSKHLKHQQKMNQQKWNFFSKKENIRNIAIGAVAITAGAAFFYFTFKHAVPLVIKQIDKVLNKPVLVQESSVPSLWEKIRNKKKVASRYSLEDLVLPSQIKEDIADLAESTRENRSHGLGYSHSGFFGAPGTGKTFTAKILAEQSGMDWVIIAGSAFNQFDEQEAIIELSNLFKWAHKSRNGLMIFIDEAESMLGIRDGKNKKMEGLVNMFLSNLETSTHEKFMFVFATNHFNRLDPAVRSRIGNKFQFPLPGEDERREQLTKKIKSEILSKGFSVDADMPEEIRQIAQNSEGLSGRDIMTIVTQCREALIRKKETKLSRNILNRVSTRILRAVTLEKSMEESATAF